MSRGALRRIGVAACCLPIAACALGVDAEAPTLARRTLVPLPEYTVWWNALEACSGIDGDLGRVRFLEVIEPLFFDGRQFPCGEGQFCNGLWEAPHDISLAPRYVQHERLVKHEMLHDLIGAPGHPPVFETCDATWDQGSGDPRRP